MTRLRAHQLALLLLLASALPAAAQGYDHYKIIRQDLDEHRHGYTVLRVWGSHRAMGRALGAALADDTLEGWSEVKGLLGRRIGRARCTPCSAPSSRTTAPRAGSTWPGPGTSP